MSCICSYSDVSSKLHIGGAQPPSTETVLTLPKCTIFTLVPAVTVSCFVQKSDSSGFPHLPQRPFYKTDAMFATFHSSGTQANVSNSLHISVNRSPGTHLGCCRSVEHYLVLVISHSSFLADCSKTSPAEVSALISSCSLSLIRQG